MDANAKLPTQESGDSVTDEDHTELDERLADVIENLLYVGVEHDSRGHRYVGQRMEMVSNDLKKRAYKLGERATAARRRERERKARLLEGAG